MTRKNEKEKGGVERALAGTTLEAHRDDPDRIRFVWPDGRRGRWWSRHWCALSLDQVLPKRGQQ